jgi:hypothetical protein
MNFEWTLFSIGGLRIAVPDIVIPLALGLILTPALGAFLLLVD